MPHDGPISEHLTALVHDAPNRPAVFIDKDHTLVHDAPYNVDPARMTLAPGVLSGACTLASCGFRLVVVTHEPGVGLGLYDESALAGVRHWLDDALGPYGVEWDGFFFCPHHPHARIARYRRWCDCRKPRAGLLRQAARELDLALAESWCVGDLLDDVEAGRRAGCRTVLVDNGKETEWDLSPLRTPDFVAADLAEAAALIVAHAPHAWKPQRQWA